MGIDLMIQSDRWAPKRILIPAGQEDAGDIHLERGTVVTGTLTSEDGAPLPGYWVLAEGLDGGMFANSWNPLRCPAKTDAAGRFSLPPLKGRFKILAPDSVQVWLGEPRLRTPSPTLAILPQDYAFDGMGGPVEVHLRAAQQVHVSGRLLTLDGQPAKREVVAIYCNVKDPQRQIELDVALANGEGHFAFQGIPRGVKEVVISGMGVRPWKPEQQLFLGMYPLPHVSGARTDGQVYLDELRSDITNIDFQFRPWKAGKGFVSQVPEEAARLPTKNAEPRESAAKAPAPAGTSLTPDEKLDWLEMEYERTLKEFIERERAARGQVQTMRPTNTPPAEYASKFLALAEAHPRTEAAFRALSWICRTASTGALSLTGGAAVSPLPTALARLQRDHLTSTNFSGALLEQIAAFLEPEADPLLQTLAETSPHREVRGQACYYLAKRLARANEKKPSTDGKQQAVRLFQRVTNDFPDLSLGRRTLGEAATRDLNEIEQLAVGKLAPEIIGVDAGGVEFKLSDHTGRIVVLMFSGEWCTPCRAQQPRLRALQAKFRDKPVRLLGVMSDPPERLREAIRKGDITWPCWCDRDWTGPITSQWNITTWPTIHVLDRRGVIRYRNASPDQLEAVLERLLQEQL
jgi:peroxiredoxin